MPQFSYSHHANLASQENLGLLVWGHGHARYYACPGHEDQAAEYEDVFRRAASEGKDLQDVIDYYLERGGGGYLSFALPEEVEALSRDAAARQVASAKKMELLVPPGPKPHCSRCGSQDKLHLITAQMCGPGFPGRVLVYCPKCRGELGHMLGVDFPLAEVDADFFVGLYRDGKTASSPDIAAEIVFGEALPDAVRGAEEALAERGGRSAIKVIQSAAKK